MIKYLVFWTIVHTIFMSSGVDKDPYGRFIQGNQLLLVEQVIQEQQVAIFSDKIDANNFVSEYQRTADFIRTKDVCKDFIVDSVKVDSLMNNQQIFNAYKFEKQKRKVEQMGK